MKNYKFLVLEDDPNRIAEFKNRFKDLNMLGNVKVEAEFTEMADECISLLKTNTYDVIFLDHDLGGETYVDPDNKNTGSEVARFINSSDIDFGNLIVIIHSMNTPAANSMKILIEEKISNTFYVVGIWFDEVFKKVISFD